MWRHLLHYPIIKKSVFAQEQLHPIDEKPHCVSKLYHALLTSTPTSTEAERCFSSAGLLNIKLRTSLKDDVIDSLCFLCSFVMQNKTSLPVQSFHYSWGDFNCN